MSSVDYYDIGHKWVPYRKIVAGISIARVKISGRCGIVAVAFVVMLVFELSNIFSTRMTEFGESVAIYM